jgi:hypothetical protein
MTAHNLKETNVMYALFFVNKITWKKDYYTHFHERKWSFVEIHNYPKPEVRN